MADFKSNIILLSIVVLSTSILSINGQITTPCTISMISSFTPCMNFITGSTGNGSSPTGDCCSTFKSLLSTSVDCACLIITGSVPFQLPINRTLALSLPRACQMSGVPIQCKGTGAPLPAPGPISFGKGAAPSPSPLSSSPTASFIPQSTSPSNAPPPNTSTLPASPPLNSETPAAIPGRRPVLTPTVSASNKLGSRISSSIYVMFVWVVMVLKYN